MNVKRLSILASLAMALALTPTGGVHAQDRDHHDGDRDHHDHDRFDDHDRERARDWYGHHHEYFHHNEGRYWHREWEGNIHEGFVLTPEMRVGIRPAPVELIHGFGPAPRGWRYVIIGDHVCLIDREYRIHDVLHFEANF
jgi:hypothetical protein